MSGRPTAWGSAGRPDDKRPCPVCLKAVPLTTNAVDERVLDDHDRYKRPGVHCPGSGRPVRR